MSNLRRRIAVLLFLSAAAPASHAAEPGGGSLTEEFSKQEQIYRSEGEQTVAGYTVDRALSVYAQGLLSDFERTLAGLGPTDRWLDVGAGEGNAVLDYVKEQPGEKAQAVAMSIEDRRTTAWKQTAASLPADKIRYLTGRRLREYSTEELGRFQLITDVVGGFSYTQTLSLFMEKVLGFLELNGSFYTVLQDVHWEDGTNRPFYERSPFLTEISDADGSELKVCVWLKRIVCAEVTCEAKPRWKPPLEAFRVRKVCNDVVVPALQLVRYEAGTPPERQFQVLRSSEKIGTTKP